MRNMPANRKKKNNNNNNNNKTKRTEKKYNFSIFCPIFCVGLAILRTRGTEPVYVVLHYGTVLERLLYFYEVAH